MKRLPHNASTTVKQPWYTQLLSKLSRSPQSKQRVALLSSPPLTVDSLMTELSQYMAASGEVMEAHQRSQQAMQAEQPRSPSQSSRLTPEQLALKQKAYHTPMMVELEQIGQKIDGLHHDQFVLGEQCIAKMEQFHSSRPGSGAGITLQEIQELIHDYRDLLEMQRVLTQTYQQSYYQALQTVLQRKSVSEGSILASNGLFHTPVVSQPKPLLSSFGHGGADQCGTCAP